MTIRLRPVECACGWSRLVPIAATEERRRMLTVHQREAHGIDPATTEGTE
jgi:hypothetical protein